jgi:hypothetical protein
MTDDAIPADLRAFILKYLDSVAHLETLLLLRGSPETRWDIAATAKRLYTTEQQAAEVLDRLCTEGLLSCEGGQYFYGGQTAALASLVEQLAQIYARHLIPVTNLIHDKPRRIRQFADAFKFKRDH